MKIERLIQAIKHGTEQQSMEILANIDAVCFFIVCELAEERNDNILCDRINKYLIHA